MENKKEAESHRLELGKTGYKVSYDLSDHDYEIRLEEEDSKKYLEKYGAYSRLTSIDEGQFDLFIVNHPKICKNLKKMGFLPYLKGDNEYIYRFPASKLGEIAKVAKLQRCQAAKRPRKSTREVFQILQNSRGDGPMFLQAAYNRSFYAI